MFRIVMSVFIMQFLGGVVSCAQDTEAPYEIPTSIPAMANRDVGGALWRIDSTYESVLHIRNVIQKSSVTVTPILWMADGTEFDLAPVTLDPAGVADVNIGVVLRDASSAVSAHRSTYGSAGLRYKWRWDDAVIATVQMRDEARSLVFSSHASSLSDNERFKDSKPRVNTLEGLWWLATKNVKPFVTLSSTASVSQTADLTLLNSSGNPVASRTFNVVPHGVTMFSIDTLFNTVPTIGTVGGLRVSYKGPPASLVVEGGLEDDEAGYSAPLPLISTMGRQARKLISDEASVTTMASLGLQLGSPEPAMLFPAGTVFAPYAVLRNLTTKPLAIELATSYMAAGPRNLILGSVLLAPQEIRSVNVQSMFASQLRNYSGEANLIFSYSGPGDALLVAAGSTAKDASYVFTVDPMIVRPEPGKIFCNWDISDANDTMVSVWNSGLTTDDAELIFFFRGGRYRVALHLVANESKSIDLKSLIHSRAPDIDGKTFPNNVTEGTARLISSLGKRRDTSILAHASIYNVTTATCYEVCPTCDNIVYATMTPDYKALGVADSTNYRAMVTANDGSTYDDSWKVSSWSSTSTSVATVNSTGVATGMSAGTSTIKAQLMEQGVPSWSDGSLCRYPLPQCPKYFSNPTSPAPVSNCPTSASIDSYQVEPLNPSTQGLYTGIGSLYAIRVSGPQPNYANTPIRELLTTVSDSCPTNPFRDLCYGTSLFLVGTATSSPFISVPPATQNVFFDHHEVVSNQDLLGYANINSCQAVCSQKYRCGGQLLKNNTVTQTFTRGVYGPAPVTNVTEVVQ